MKLTKHLPADIDLNLGACWQVLEGFIQSVLDHEEGAQEGGGAAAGRGTAIVRRFVKWHRRVDKVGCPITTIMALVPSEPLYV
jgi:hypothetical protein